MISTPKIIAAAATLLLAGAIITSLFFSKANNSLKEQLSTEKLNSEKLLSEKLELKKNVDRANKDIDQFKTDINILQGTNTRLDLLLAASRKSLSEKLAEINRLQQELTKLNATDDTLTDQVETCLKIVANLPNFYANGDLTLKQQLIGLIYPEKAVLKENTIQTIRPNRAIELISRPSAHREYLQKKMAFKNEDHSNVVTLSGFKPETF